MAATVDVARGHGARTDLMPWVIVRLSADVVSGLGDSSLILRRIRVWQGLGLIGAIPVIRMRLEGFGTIYLGASWSKGEYHRDHDDEP